jgi:hypothetical protein
LLIIWQEIPSNPCFIVYLVHILSPRRLTTICSIAMSAFEESGIFEVTKFGAHPVSYLQGLIPTQCLAHSLDTAYRCLLSLLPPSLAPMTFEVSGAVQSSTNERSQTARATLLRRLFQPKVLLCLSYCGYASVPLLVHLGLYLSPNEPSQSTVFFIFPGVILKLLDCIFKSSVPVWYMIFPPTTLKRSDLLTNRAKKGKENCGRGFNSGGLWLLEFLSCLVIWSGLR